jgi:hypothetical protein
VSHDGQQLNGATEHEAHRERWGKGGQSLVTLGCHFKNGMS